MPVIHRHSEGYGSTSNKSVDTGFESELMPRYGEIGEQLSNIGESRMTLGRRQRAVSIGYQAACVGAKDKDSPGDERDNLR